jgi:pSer/pThr/pTyr-binding forkhead associated (FHA) protein
MKLEVQNGETEPIIYILNKSETYIGSRDTNDIVIGSNEISAKHLKVVIVEDTCFVIDQGSTNGTFINETQLVPGRRVELIPYEPVLLGHKVFITLLDKSKKIAPTRPIPAPTEQLKAAAIIPDQRPDPNPSSDKTRVISLKEMNLAKEKSKVKKREKLAVKRKAESKRIREEKKALKRVTVIALSWLVGGVILQVAWKKLPSLMKKSYAPQKVYVDRVAMEEGLEGQDQEFKIAKNSIHSNETLITYLGKSKCKSSIEMAFCDKLPEYRTESNGVIELDGDLVFYMQKRNWYAKAEPLLRNEKTLDEDNVDPNDIKKMAVIQLIEASLGKSLPENFRPRNFYIVLYSSPTDLAVVAVFKSQILPTIAMKTYKLEHRNDKLDGSDLIRALAIYIQYPYIDPF